MTDSKMFITDKVIQVMNDLVKQEVTPDRIQWYNIYYELILLDLFANTDLYDNDSYALPCPSDSLARDRCCMISD